MTPGVITMNTILYIRQSKDSKNAEESLAGQEQECRTYADKCTPKLKITQVLRDTVTSALFKEANDNIAELENVAFLVYDVYLEGHHTNIKDIETWTIPIVNDYDHEMETEVRLSVRKVIVNVQPKVDNMEELAKQPSPAGILANNILAIQNGGSTEFLDELLKRWNLKLENINTAGTYQPLRATVKLFDKPDMGVKKYILHECNRLLGELLAQQAK